MSNIAEDEENATRLLIVDDTVENLVFLAQLLRSAGYRCRSARNGRQALQAALHELPDLVLLDVMMPEMNGYEVCHRFKSNPYLQGIPIIFISAATDTEVKVRAFTSGGVDFVCKPFEAEEVLARIKTHLALHSAERQLERRLVERTRELAASETRYRYLVETLRDDYFFYSRDPGGEIIYVSPSVRTVLGYGQDEFKTRIAGRTTETPLAIEHHDGIIRYLEVSETLVAGDDGVVFAIEGIAHDITRRKRTEEEIARYRDHLEALVLERTRELRHSEEHLHLVLGAAAEGIFAVDLEGICTICNPATARFLGYGNTADIVGRQMHDFLLHRLSSEAGADFADCPICQSFQYVRTPPHDDNTVFWRQDGSCFRVDYASHPILRNGIRIGTVVSFIDITNRLQTERALRHAQKMDALGNLAGGVAHELNNMLAPVLFLTEVAVMEVPDGSKVKSRLEKVLKAANRAKDLVSRILTFSRQAKSDRIREIIDIRRIVRETTALMRSTLPHTMEIRENIDDRTGAVVGDATELETVLLNLITNAIDAVVDMAGQGLLEISLAPVDLTGPLVGPLAALKPGAHVRLTVIDNGYGMDDQTLQRIFDPFFTTKDVGKGTGLGLSMVHGIITEHNGAIAVTSAPGRGTKFDVFLPMGEAIRERRRKNRGQKNG